jgi:hypothetical protein
LLDEHHARLRDALALSTPRIEALRTAALAAGALGAKVNGSGGGGSLFAYAPGCEAAVIAAAHQLGARPRRDGEPRRVGRLRLEAAPRVLRVEAVAESRLPRASIRNRSRRPARRTCRCRSGTPPRFVTRRRLSRASCWSEGGK